MTNEPSAPTPLNIWGALPSAWKRHADGLRLSAHHMWEPLEAVLNTPPPHTDAVFVAAGHFFAFMLIAGAALEAMAKAAAIQAHMKVDGLAQVVTNGALARWLTTHNLVALANRAQVAVTAQETEWLERFAKFVVWAGSYPTTKDLADPHHNKALDWDGVPSLDDIGKLEHLYGRFEAAYEAHLAELKAKAP